MDRSFATGQIKMVGNENSVTEVAANGHSCSVQNPCKSCKMVYPQNEYIPLIRRIKHRIESNDVPFFSFEYFPPKTVEGAINLVNRFDRMRQAGPLFVDITWHAGGNPGGDSETSSITIAGVALNYCGLDTMLHITCVNLTEEDLKKHLERAKSLGIRNILALRGDSDGSVDPKNIHFRYAVDLVRWIKKNYGDYFTICVAGYAKGHPEAESYEKSLEYLKEKIDAGADFIITQLFFEAKVFIKFVEDCRRIGIEVPIFPGIMPIQSYDSLKRIVKISQLEVPQQLLDILEPNKENDEAVRNLGIEWAVDMCRSLIESKATPGLHFYTLNIEHATRVILKRLGLWSNTPHKALPWITPANYKRCTEDVRPIFWAARPKSYVYRTQTWDEFPNGRWGHADSPAFGDLKEYYLFLDHKYPKEELLNLWGHELTKEEDVWEIFYCYVTGQENKHGKVVKKMPWNNDELQQETNLIKDKLALINKRGFLTINSQPNVNGIDSSDPVHGWGVPNGYVYQKAYLEFFTSEENVIALLKILEKYPLVNYHIVNSGGDKDYTNCHQYKPIAVTWGVFPGKEIIQPTVVDPISFKVWKDEAFGLWREKWASLYAENSPSKNLLNNVIDKYYLVNLVDNQFPKECCLWQLLDDVHKERSQT